MPTQADQQAANSDEQAANGGKLFAAQWLTVAEVADRLKVTPRTIQKRCKAGKLDARSVETPTGDQWQINAAAVETQGTKAANEATNRVANSREQAANRSQPQPDAATDFRARYIAQIEEQNSFLKSQLEDANRNAAELRSALRKALEIAPRQLAQGNAPETQEATQKSAATKDSHADESAPKKPVNRAVVPDWNSIYGQIADELEAQELNQ